jgi:hypothetical protein
MAGASRLQNGAFAGGFPKVCGESAVDKRLIIFDAGDDLGSSH